MARGTGGCDYWSTVIKMLIETPLHFHGENSFPELHRLGLAATNLRRYLVEGIIFLVLYLSSFVGLGKRDENPCPPSLWPAMATMTQGYLSLLKVDLVVGVYFKFCNGSPWEKRHQIRVLPLCNVAAISTIGW